MPEPFAQPEAPSLDSLSNALEKGVRAIQMFALGLDRDLKNRQQAIVGIAITELRCGTLTPDRALLHFACINALIAYSEELHGDIRKAERASGTLHAEPDNTRDDA